MRGKITKRAVDAVPAGDVDAFLWDAELRGFGIKVTPTGRRVFIVQYWAPGLTRVRRRVTLGTHGPLTVEQARTAAQRILGLVAGGEDPAADAQSSRAAVGATVAVVSAAYLDEVAAKMQRTTVSEYRRIFRVYILPALGKKPIADVGIRDVAALHLSHKVRPYQGNRILQLLKTFFFWAEARGYRPTGSNPCRGISAFPEAERERFLTTEEIGRLGAALWTAEHVGLPPAPKKRKAPRSPETAKHRPKSADKPFAANPFAVAAIRFLLLTGWREQEALTLRWADVDLVRGAATLPATKTGKSQRPIGAAAIALLEALPKLDSPYVFPGAVAGAPLRDLSRIWSAARHAAGLADVRLHDLRHTVASFAVGSGHSLYLTGKLLGHARAETTQRYAHLADDARKAAADTVASELAAALDRVSTPVVPLAPRRPA